MIFFYHLFRLLYLGAIRLASTWNTKARLWVAGRKNWEQALTAKWSPGPGARSVWMHCASLGEFEQGRPLLEAIRNEYPGVKILLTFFSPSGYEIRKKYAGADAVCYLPFDSPVNARRFLDLAQPSVAIFVKYEFWHFYLQELHTRSIPTLLVSGIFRPDQPFFQWWGSFHRRMLLNFSHLFVQDENSKKLLAEAGFGSKTTIAGDTRFDRVHALALTWQPVEGVAAFCGEDPVLVAGSTWPEDEQLLANFLKDDTNIRKLILAPHEINAGHMTRLQQLFPGSVLFSELATISNPEQKNCLIIDNVGYLSRLYRYGTFCYVGGGFNKSGHHNILEAAVYGKPVITGPNFQKFRESIDLKKQGGSFTVERVTDLKKIMEEADWLKAGAAAAAYVQQNSGATACILQWIQEKRLLTSE
jgi:3-deoxy-D-manno-octulosonic-acid transferase